MSTDRKWIKNMWFNNGILLRHKKEQNKAIWNNIAGPEDCHNE